MSKDKKIEKYGYRPLDAGYKPDIQKGYVPSDPEATIDPSDLPKGGTGQSNTGDQDGSDQSSNS